MRANVMALSRYKYLMKTEETPEMHSGAFVQQFPVEAF